MEIFIMFVLASSALYFFVRTIMLAKEVVDLKDFIAREMRATYFNDAADKESFLKFVSDSREWAFDYIEEVQKGLTQFVEAVDRDIEHFDQYGITIDSPLHDAMNNISSAYKDLKTLLPKEAND
jgi:hypothetical protein